MLEYINKEDFHKIRLMAISAGVVWSFWIFFDLFFVKPSMMDYCFFIRIIFPLTFIPISLLPRNIIEKHITTIFTLEFNLAFASLFHLYFYTNNFQVYFTCSMLVPFLSNLLLVKPFRLFLLSPLVFYIMTITHIKKVITLSNTDLFFFFFFSSTVFALSGVIAFFNYRNRVKSIKLQRELKKSLENQNELSEKMKNDFAKILSSLDLNESILNIYEDNIVEKSQEYVDQILKSIQKNKEEQLEKSKLLTLGDMASNISHELNTPLMIIKSKALLIEKKNNNLNPDLEIIKNQADKINNILINFNKFNKREYATEIVFLREILTKSSKIIRNKDIKVFIIGDNTISSEINKEQMTLVLENLIENAEEYMERTHVENPWISINLVENNGLNQIEISNEGDPIPEEIKKKIFDPFYSSKPINEAPGLGLTMCRKIIKSFNGELIYSGDKYPSFRIILPSNEKKSLDLER